MSGAMARANSPVNLRRSSQSSFGPGLPWTKTTASLASGSPAISTGDRTPSTVTSMVTGSLTLRSDLLRHLGFPSVAMPVDRDELGPTVQTATPTVSRDQVPQLAHDLATIGVRPAHCRSRSSEYNRRGKNRGRLAAMLKHVPELRGTTLLVQLPRHLHHDRGRRPGRTEISRQPIVLRCVAVAPACPSRHARVKCFIPVIDRPDDGGR